MNDKGDAPPFLARWGLSLILLLAVGLLLAYWRGTLAETGGVLGAPLDDAWIHFQFARSLSQGDGFSYVPGVPTPGSTAPLWTLLLAGVALFTDRLMAPALLLSGGFFLLTILLTERLARAATGRWEVGLAAALGVALTGRLLWAGLSAMEVTLFAALSLAAVLAYQRRGLDPLTAILFGLASQTRPEGQVLFALAAAGAGWGLLRDAARRRQWRAWLPLLGALGVYGLIQLPYALFSLSVTGRPLPNTFYAKSSGGDLYSWRTLRETLLLHWQDNPVAALLLLLGLIPLWRRQRLSAAWLLCLLLLVPAIVPFVWHHGRYTLPLVPFQMIAAAAGLFWLADRLRRRGLTALLLALFALGGAWGVPAWGGMLANNVREVEEIDVALGRWLAANVPAADVVAVDDIGAIVYLSPRPIVDLNGLVSPEMWAARADPDFSAATVHLLAARDVAYLAVFPAWHAPLVANPEMARPVARFQTATQTIIGAREAAVYAMDWPYRREIAPQAPLDVALGDVIRLRGSDWTADQSTAQLTLYWESVRPTPLSYKVFVHVLDETGAIVTQADSLPVNGLAPTTFWVPGDLLRDRYDLLLPPGAAAGRYQVRVGLYTEATGRLPVVDPLAEGDAVLVGEWVVGGSR